jgi:hypothetical protein
LRADAEAFGGERAADARLAHHDPGLDLQPPDGPLDTVRLDAASLDRKSALLNELTRMAAAETRQNRRETREDRRELREDRRETREDRRQSGTPAR